MNRKSSWLTLSACAAVLALSVSLSGNVLGAGDTAGTLMEQKIAGARTKADHESLAASYEQEATRLQEKAGEHKAMGKAYKRTGALQEKHQLVTHCGSLVKKYEDAARENSALAKLHRGLAAKAQS